LRRSQKFLPPNSFAKFIIYNVRLPHHSNYFYKHTKLIYLYRLGGSRISRTVFNIRESRLVMKYLIMPRACRRSHISRAPFAPLGSGAHSAPAWVGWLPANFIAGSALLVACSRVRVAASHSVLTFF